MKKLLLLFIVMLAFCVSAMAQSTVPKPHNPIINSWEEAWNPDAQFYFNLTEDWDGNLVADDYTVEAEFTGGTWTTLDPDKVTWSIYTDDDQLFTFTPEEFADIDAPTTELPYGFRTGGVLDMGTIDESITIYFHNRLAINATENPFFTWRIGAQVHYTVDGVKASSDIIYLEVFPKMKPATEITSTSFVADWTSPANNVQHAGFVGYDLYVIDKATGDTTLIADIPAWTQPNPDWGYDEAIPGRTYLVEDLTPGHTYQYYVVGKHHWGAPTVDIPSNVQEVTLPGSEPAFIRGDVDGEGHVNMDDLTQLINFMLTGDYSLINVPNSASCSSIEDTTEVNMDDLTALINFLLNGAWDD